MKEIPTTLKTIKMKISDIPAPISKHHHITTTLISLFVSAVPSTSFTVSSPLVVMPELAIPADAFPEHLNKSDGDKDYLCQFVSLFTFQFRFDSDPC